MIETSVVTVGTALSCGHSAPEREPGSLITGVAWKVDQTGKNPPESMCYPCADEVHRAELLALPIGHNHHAYARLAFPIGRNQGVGELGQITSWSGGVLGQIVPGTMAIQEGTGFSGSHTRRYHFRAVVPGMVGTETVDALFYCTAPGDGMLTTIKRMIGRNNPAGPAPHPHTKQGKLRRGHAPQTRIRKGLK